MKGFFYQYNLPSFLILNTFSIYIAYGCATDNKLKCFSIFLGSPYIHMQNVSELLVQIFMGDNKRRAKQILYKKKGFSPITQEIHLLNKKYISVSRNKLNSNVRT